MTSALPSCFRCLRIGGNLLRTRSGGSLVPSLAAEQRRWKVDDRKALVESTPKKDMGTQGEKELDIDLMGTMDKGSLFPDESTPNQLFNGVRFADIPVCHIKVSKNNTIMHVTDHEGNHIAYRSCGLDGFKNTKKGTNIAAQTTALSLAAIAKEKGISQVRVAIQGLGPGRISSVKGLQMGGISIVAIADTTPISWNPPRARKARRI